MPDTNAMVESNVEENVRHHYMSHWKHGSICREISKLTYLGNCFNIPRSTINGCSIGYEYCFLYAGIENNMTAVFERSFETFD